jgi:hypothetical protein
MWRKFLGVGIPLAVLGLVFYIIGLSGAASDPWGGGDGNVALTVIGLLLMLPGFMLANAGLIGAAVSADILSRTQSFAGPARTPGPVPGMVPEQQVARDPSERGDTFRGALLHDTDGAEAAEVPLALTCPGCGNVPESGAAFCATCGARLGGA